MLRRCAPPRRLQAAPLLDQGAAAWPAGSSARPGSTSMASWLGIDRALTGVDDRELASSSCCHLIWCYHIFSLLLCRDDWYCR